MKWARAETSEASDPWESPYKELTPPARPVHY